MEAETKLEEQNEVKSAAKTENENKVLKNDTLQLDGQSEEDKEAIKKKATLLFLQGKRSIYIRDYYGALVALSESCQLFSQIYPEKSDELADPYFYYGKALLEVGRSESEVLGGDQVQDEDEDEDEDDEDEEMDEGSAEVGKDANGENGTSSHNDKSEGPTNSNGEESDEKKEEKENENSENGEINDLQLSWEYLELAKLIYMKKAETCRETAIKLAETYLCLGENGLESENYSVAIEDIKHALDLQKKHLKEEDRRIAETYYQLGVAHSLCQNYDEATESFKEAIAQLEKKIASLEMRKKIGDKKTEEEEKDAFYTMDGEMNEIRAVIKDVEDKIKDMMESKNKVKAELLKQVCGEGQSSSSSAEASGGASSSIPATDISHLIKRKRKSDEDDGGQGKKSKTD